MKKSFIKTIILSLALVPFACFFNQKNTAVYADSPTPVGRRAITAYGYEGVKTFISSSDVTFYQSTGRTVYSEIPGGPPIIESLGDQPNFNNPNLLPRVYYYYPTSTLPKIVSIVDVYFDWDSIVFMVGELEDRVYSCVSSYPELNLNYIEQTLIFLRSINVSYTDDDWNLCGGPLNTELLSVIANEQGKWGISFLEYFSSFLECSSLYNSSLYGALTNSHFGTTLYDYLDTSHEYDLIHMFASANCFRTNTVFSSIDGFENALDSLTSWGGDLQQATKYCSINNITPTSFDQILSLTNAGFRWSDFYADIDAKNLCYYISQMNTISSSLDYLLDFNTSQRFYTFVSTSIYPDFNSFVVHGTWMLNIDNCVGNPFGLIDVINSPFAQLFIQHPIFDVYKFMRLADNSLPSSSFRVSILNLFVQKIGYLAGFSV